MCDITKIGSHKYEIDGVGEYTVEVIDSIEDYLEMMKEIFDFPLLKMVITGQAGPCPGQTAMKINVLANALNGGVYDSLCWRLKCFAVTQLYNVATIYMRTCV